VFDILSQFVSFIRLSSLLSYKGASLSILMILTLLSSSMIGDLNYIHAQGPPVCDRQTFSLVNCSGALSSEGDTNGAYILENNEQQTPMIIPFP
jgi:hypothetical protein